MNPSVLKALTTDTPEKEKRKSISSAFHLVVVAAAAVKGEK